MLSHEDRRVASQLLAKTLAYVDCAKMDKASERGKALRLFLEQLGVDTDYRNAKYQQAQASGMNATDSEEFAYDQATR